MVVKRKVLKSSSTENKKRKSLGNDSVDVTEFLRSTLSLVQELRDGSRLIRTQFLKLPSKKLYPDYFEKIQTPISLQEIKQKIDRSEYSSASQFANDFKLMAENAIEFNLQESVIAQDALKISSFVHDQVTQFSQKEESNTKSIEKETPKIKLKFGSKKETDLDKQNSHITKIKFKKDVKHEEKPQSVDTEVKNNNDTNTNNIEEVDNENDKFLKVTVSSDMKHKLMPIVENLMSYHIDADNISEVFMEEPSRKLYPDYYEIITTPMSLTSLKKNLNNRKTQKYPTVADFVHDALLICANAQTYNEESSLIYEFADLLADYFISMFDKLTISEGYERCHIKSQLKKMKKSVINIAASRSASLAPPSVEGTPQPTDNSTLANNDHPKKKTRNQKIKADMREENFNDSESKSIADASSDVSMKIDRNTESVSNDNVSQVTIHENINKISLTDTQQQQNQVKDAEVAGIQPTTSSFEDLPNKGLAQLRSVLKYKEAKTNKPLVSLVNILSSRPKAFYNSQRIQQSHGNGNDVLAKTLFQNWFEYIFEAKQNDGELTNYAMNLPLSSSSANKGAITVYVTLNLELSGKSLNTLLFVNNDQVKPTPHSTYANNESVLTSRYDLKLALGLNHLRVVANVFAEDKSTVISEERVNFWVTVS